MNFPKFLRVAVVGHHRREIINGTTTLVKTFDAVDSQITHLFSESLGFSYELISPDDSDTGNILPNGTWTGMIGMILQGHADIAISRIVLSEDRIQVLPFTYPYASVSITFITQKPIYTPNIVAFLKPFALEVWIFLISSIFIMSFIFYILLAKRYDFSMLLLRTYSMFLQQDLLVEPQKISEYLIIGFWKIPIVFLSFGYVALLLSFITFPPLTGVRTIPELSAAVAEGEYRCISYPGGSASRVLSKSNDPVMRIIGENIRRNPGSRDIDGVLQMSEKSVKTAFVGSILSILPFKGKYFISDDTFYHTMFGIPLHKDFCCKQKINNIISYIQAAGLIEKITLDYTFRKTLQTRLYSSDNNKDIQRKLSLLDFQGAFVFLIVGHTLSFIVFVTEVFIGKTRQIQKRHKRNCKGRNMKVRYRKYVKNLCID